MSPELDDFTQAYIECALWSSTGEPFGTCEKCAKDDTVLYWNAESRKHELCLECSGEMAQKSPYEPPLDDNYSILDIAPEALTTMVEECVEFQSTYADELAEWYTYGESPERAGHDLWLTRNGHGAGYWDRWSNGGKEEKLGRKLTDYAHSYGSYDLYVSDDGKLYIS